MHPLHLNAESIPGVVFSILGSCEGDSKIWKQLTLKGDKSSLTLVGDVLEPKFNSHDVSAEIGFRFFRAPRGRLHPQF